MPADRFKYMYGITNGCVKETISAAAYCHSELYTHVTQKQSYLHTGIQSWNAKEMNEVQFVD